MLESLQPTGISGDQARRKPDGLPELQRMFGATLGEDQIAQLQRLDPVHCGVFLDRMRHVYEQQSSTPRNAPRRMELLGLLMEGYSVRAAAAQLNQLTDTVRNSVVPLGNILNRDQEAIQDAFRVATAAPRQLHQTRQTRPASRAAVAPRPEAPDQALAVLAANWSGLGWRALALCASTDPKKKIDPDIFYPGKGRSAKEAQTVCLSCEVREACLEEALEIKDEFGVWGGTSVTERRDINRKKLGVVLRTHPEDRIQQLVSYLGSSKLEETAVILGLHESQDRRGLFVQSLLGWYAVKQPETKKIEFENLRRYFNGQRLDAVWPRTFDRSRLSRFIINLVDFIRGDEHDLADPLAYFWAQSEGSLEPDELIRRQSA